MLVKATQSENTLSLIGMAPPDSHSNRVENSGVIYKSDQSQARGVSAR